MEISCQKCGLVNDYFIKESGQHKTAYCNGCGSYIKHIPQNNPVDTLPFGKFKGRELKTMKSNEELRYLEWLSSMPDLKPKIKEAIRLHLLSC